MAEIVTKSGSGIVFIPYTKYIYLVPITSHRSRNCTMQCDTIWHNMDQWCSLAFLVAKMSWTTWSISRWLKSSEVVALCCMAVVGVGGNRTVLPVGLTGYHLTINTASGAYSVSSRTQVWLQGELYHSAAAQRSLLESTRTPALRGNCDGTRRTHPGLTLGTKASAPFSSRSSSRCGELLLLSCSVCLSVSAVGCWRLHEGTLDHRRHCARSAVITMTMQCVD